jgi:hypothetical protein
MVAFLGRGMGQPARALECIGHPAEPSLVAMPNTQLEERFHI